MASSMASSLPVELAGIRYSICEAADVPGMARTLGETFARHDPPAVAVRLTPDEFEAFVLAVSRSAADNRLTIVARDVESGAIVGALLAEDATAALPEDMDQLSSKFEPIFELFGQLSEPGGPPPAPAPSAVLHLFLLGVDERYARRGIAQQLVRACLANGAARGYGSAITEATNLVSQHIFRSQGFVRCAQTSYADYRFGGDAVFASIADQGGPMAMARSLRTDA